MRAAAGATVALLLLSGLGLTGDARADVTPPEWLEPVHLLDDGFGEVDDIAVQGLQVRVVIGGLGNVRESIVSSSDGGLTFERFYLDDGRALDLQFLSVSSHPSGGFQYIAKVTDAVNRHWAMRMREYPFGAFSGWDVIAPVTDADILRECPSDESLRQLVVVETFDFLVPADNRSNVYTLASEDGGDSWTRGTELWETWVFDAVIEHCVRAEDGYLVVARESVVVNAGFDHFLLFLIDEGTLMDRVDMPDAVSNDLSVAPDGTARVFWQDQGDPWFLAMLRPPYESLGPTIELPFSEDSAALQSFEVRYGPGGEPHVIWLEGIFPLAAPSRLKYASGDRSWTQWSGEQLLGGTSARVQEILVSGDTIAVDAHGNVHVPWHERAPGSTEFESAPMYRRMGPPPFSLNESSVIEGSLSPFTIRGTVARDGSVQVRIDDGAWQNATGSPQWEFLIHPVPETVQTLEIRACQEPGTLCTDGMTVTVLGGQALGPYVLLVAVALIALFAGVSLLVWRRRKRGRDRPPFHQLGEVDDANR